jgi:DnaJ-domain-containing protein 1
MGILERLLRAAMLNIIAGFKTSSYDSNNNFWEKYQRYEKYKDSTGNSDSYERARSYYQNYNKKNYYQKQDYKSTVKNEKLAQYYANLELPNGSNLEEVKKAWKRLLKQYHPDKHSLDEEKRKVATVLTQKLNEAYFELEKELKNK